MTGLETTYTMAVPPAPAMSWTEYERHILAEWRVLLAKTPAPTEREIQRFIELHPSLLPGAFNVLGLESGHYPQHCALISQPPLPSYDRRIPDFMWLSGHSEAEIPVLVEIEAPTKRWFTANERPTADFNQALDQIREWKAWFAVPHNVIAFKEFYRLDSHAWRRRRFRPEYLLIYGRRTEANATANLTSKRGFLHSEEGIVSMTFDRLAPNPKSDQFICAKVDKTGSLRAISVPPTIQWMPGLADSRAVISDMETAIQANNLIDEERKNFLVERIPYWRQWVQSGQVGIMHGGDAE